jgi:hypothetical protein
MVVETGVASTVGASVGEGKQKRGGVWKDSVKTGLSVKETQGSIIGMATKDGPCGGSEHSSHAWGQYG